jgi:serine/threonine-protein kinase
MVRLARSIGADHLAVGRDRRARLVQPLGKGAVSTVYRAVLENELGLERAVAVKLFDSVSSDEAELVLEALRTTACRAALVRHPNVVEVFDLGLHHAQAFFVEELVEGVSLAALMERWAERGRRVPLDLALFVASEIAEGLSGARTAKGPEGMMLGMAHGGLTAREVLLSWRGEVKVSDFEVSTARGASSSVRSLRAVANRASTMAPEVAQGYSGDARADVFSLGVLMRELLVGPRFPKDISNAEAVRLAREGYVHPICFGPQLPAPLLQVMTRALEVEPEQRYPNASAMAFDLRRITLSMGVGDGRWFLRRALDAEWGNDASEVTAENRYPRADADADDGIHELSEEDVHDD